MKLLLSIFLAWALYAQQGPRGHWSGVVEIPDHPQAVEVDLDLAANMWIGSISAPDQNISGAPLENIAFLNGRWTFRIKGMPGNPTYTGIIQPDGNVMAGEFTQAAHKYPFKLLRSGDAQVEPPKSSPALAESFLGTWEGGLYFSARPTRVMVRMANDEAGAKAILIIVDQGGSEIPISSVVQNGPKLDLQITIIGASYKGEINKEGNLLTGAWTQAAAPPMPLVLRKAPRP